MTSPRAVPHLLVGVGGGIAAYKICDVISTQVKAGWQVSAILSETASQFITPLTLSTLCRRSVLTDADFWHPQAPRPLHIELAEKATLMLVAPLTANTLAKLVLGLADNLLTSTVLASQIPILVAPAMNTTMWEQPTVQSHWQQLQQQPRYHCLPPAYGRLACDSVGVGRMAETQEIIAYLDSLAYTHGKRDLAGKHLLITAGGTREYWDTVRFIGNPATGKMGIALARAALHRGAKVTLIYGAIAEPIPAQVRAIEAISSEAMCKAVLEVWPEADWLVMAAAVGDVRPAQQWSGKLPKSELPTALPLSPVPDILQAVAQMRQPHQRLIGFAAQTGDIVTPAREKLERKGLDLIVANAVDQADGGFGSSENAAVVLDRQGRSRDLAKVPKLILAHQIFDVAQEWLP
ncbi:bifunctional phosphopantothenoylcysteine decarboxylase/phosphopantothenate--cysteine ligase CoaBC [Thermosynechococcus sp. GLH187]|uniref:bifunctional phosphopantothenoylcysteine decarboxylase/phosphopantothenate--cysteine ligase CoaBC n=1 Tax=unclassified Thermosynechococcus TaxID=2622553 RepID=UPI002877B246|nr:MULTISPECIES: bifunctional phosphopantothenoylcysteine decarboxylase/phosphopantothenate--cysteine ligase CoaBC [unclassified Thermosynechococcus]WNC44652.1 bifunctional phosphopantothenoylcysteine decarboxylase/phosphopantothenate--cysteine ligase CoaBC [Thermosynechococcus sp. GLH187]WNC47188.1 bifunctional phosphopantothenoylcysteine decarboxylase/phosphopantothenate--cysteine ligase CoaBC [Thermosynechococcus sp. GLH333]WNC49725.1 bifunctional phosphopantothenoylcysteine decarboxylase/pho